MSTNAEFIPPVPRPQDPNQVSYHRVYSDINYYRGTRGLDSIYCAAPTSVGGGVLVRLSSVISPLLLLFRYLTFHGRVVLRHHDMVDGKYDFLGEMSASIHAMNRFVIAITESQEMFVHSLQNCLHLEFALGGSSFLYTTGDHDRVVTTNAVQDVNRFLYVFGMLQFRNRTLNITVFKPPLQDSHPKSVNICCHNTVLY